MSTTTATSVSTLRLVYECPQTTGPQTTAANFGLIPILFEGRVMFEESNLKSVDAAFFHGCSRSRTMITKKKMEPENYASHVSVNPKDATLWTRASETYKRSKMLVSQEWAIKNVPALHKCTPIEATEQAVAAGAATAKTAVEEGTALKTENVVEEKEKVELRMRPELLFLEDSEKFKDEDGNPLEIEVCGGRTAKGCYFKMVDVSKVFDMPSINRNVLRDDRGFIRNIHYECFNIKLSNGESANKKQQALYLTYKGMLKVLFSSRTGRAESFQDWATDTLFTAQMGAQDDQDRLAAKLLRTDADSVKQVFRCNNAKTPCIYIFEIGGAGDLLKPEEYESNYTQGAPNDYRVFKYGYTDDLPRRTAEHEKYYRDEFGASIELVSFSIVDPKFLSEAESSMKNYFRRDRISHVDKKGVTSTELVVVHKTEVKNFKEHFKLIQNSLVGCYAALLDKIKQLEFDVERQKDRHSRELSDLKAEMHMAITEKDNIIEKNAMVYKNELLEQRLEMLAAMASSAGVNTAPFLGKK